MMNEWTFSDFGLPPGIEASEIPKGPVLFSDMEDVVVVGSDVPLVIECIAAGNPMPTYQWTVKDLSDGATSKYRNVCYLFRGKHSIVVYALIILSNVYQ